MPRVILISGASGFFGTALRSAFLLSGERVISLTRSPSNPAEDVFNWRDPSLHELPKIDIVIHLAGENISAKRWSPKFKEALWASRIDSCRSLIELLSKYGQRPALFMSASAIGIYGNRGDEKLSEMSPHGTGFLAELARGWEAAALKAASLGATVTLLRFGIILSPKGGALQKMMLPFKYGLGGCLGDGRQFMSWISLEDAVKAVSFLTHRPYQGAVNITSPGPVTNREFSNELANALGRLAIFPVPKLMVKILFGQMADEALLASQRVAPAVLESFGFKFEHSSLREYMDRLKYGDVLPRPHHAETSQTS